MLLCAILWFQKINFGGYQKVNAWKPFFLSFYNLPAYFPFFFFLTVTGNDVTWFWELQHILTLSTSSLPTGFLIRKYPLSPLEDAQADWAVALCHSVGVIFVPYPSVTTFLISHGSEIKTSTKLDPPDLVFYWIYYVIIDNKIIHLA